MHVNYFEPFSLRDFGKQSIRLEFQALQNIVADDYHNRATGAHTTQGAGAEALAIIEVYGSVVCPS